jgi:hypothetical protein
VIHVIDTDRLCDGKLDTGEQVGDGSLSRKTQSDADDTRRGQDAYPELLDAIEEHQGHCGSHNDKTHDQNALENLQLGGDGPGPQVVGGREIQLPHEIFTGRPHAADAHRHHTGDDPQGQCLAGISVVRFSEACNRQHCQQYKGRRHRERRFAPFGRGEHGGDTVVPVPLGPLARQAQHDRAQQQPHQRAQYDHDRTEEKPFPPGVK